MLNNCLVDILYHIICDMYLYCVYAEVVCLAIMSLIGVIKQKYTIIVLIKLDGNKMQNKNYNIFIL